MLRVTAMHTHNYLQCTKHTKCNRGKQCIGVILVAQGGLSGGQECPGLL